MLHFLLVLYCGRHRCSGVQDERSDYVIITSSSSLRFGVSGGTVLLPEADSGRLHCGRASSSSRECSSTRHDRAVIACRCAMKAVEDRLSSRGLRMHAIPAKFDIDSSAPTPPPIVRDSRIPLIRHQKAAVSSASAGVLLRDRPLPSWRAALGHPAPRRCQLDSVRVTFRPSERDLSAAKYIYGVVDVAVLISGHC